MAPADLVVAEIKAASKLRAEAWNTFLACELGNKGRDVLQTLGPDYSKWQALLAEHPALTDRERDLARKADNSLIDGLLITGVQVLEASEMPDHFQETPGTTPGLFSWGDPSLLDTICVAIIGTRGASTYGKACALKFSEALAGEGVTIVSGGAMGIDTAAHEGALNVGGSTIAVLPSGIDVPYPAVNANLFDRIKTSGCLLSQFAVGRKAQFHSPLIRNVTVSALCQAVVVIEAPGKSGSIHTAGQAAEMGREVFVVPGPIDRPSFIGSHNLIRDGATLIWHPDQVLESIGMDRMKRKKKPTVQGNAGKILSVLTSDSIPAERIVELSELDAQVVLSELTMLEMDGLVFRNAGGYSLVI